MSTRTRITENLARGCREAGGCGLVPLNPTLRLPHYRLYLTLPTPTPLSPEGPRTTNSMTKLVLLLIALLAAPALSFDVCGNFCGPVRKRRGEGEGRKGVEASGEDGMGGGGGGIHRLVCFVVHD